MVDVALEVKEEVARGEAEMVDLVLSGDNRLVLLASFIQSASTSRKTHSAVHFDAVHARVQHNVLLSREP